jgi:hypothetical protein
MRNEGIVPRVLNSALGGPQRRSARYGNENSCPCRKSNTSISAPSPVLYQMIYPGCCASDIIIIFLIPLCFFVEGWWRACLVLWLQCPCALCGFMVAIRHACPLCDKPFYGKQKFFRCGACEVRIHCVCLQLREAKQVAISATGESVYRCDVCAKSLGSSSSVKASAK